MRKLNWNGYLLFMSMCSLAGMSNNNFSLISGFIFGLCCGILWEYLY